MSNTANYGWPKPVAGQVDKLTSVQQAFDQADEDLKALDSDVKNPGWNHVARFYDGSTPAALKIITNMSVINRMVNIKLSGTYGGYTQPFEALLSFYYYAGQVHNPQLLWSGSFNASSLDVEIGNENGVFVIVLSGALGAHASLDVYARYGTLNVESYARISNMTVVAEDKEPDNTTFVAATMNKIYHSANTLIDPTTGCIAPA